MRHPEVTWERYCSEVPPDPSQALCFVSGHTCAVIHDGNCLSNSLVKRMTLKRVRATHPLKLAVPQSHS